MTSCNFPSNSVSTFDVEVIRRTPNTSYVSTIFNMHNKDILSFDPPFSAFTNLCENGTSSSSGRNFSLESGTDFSTDPTIKYLMGNSSALSHTGIVFGTNDSSVTPPTLGEVIPSGEYKIITGFSPNDETNWNNTKTDLIIDKTVWGNVTVKSTTKDYNTGGFTKMELRVPNVIPENIHIFDTTSITVQSPSIFVYEFRIIRCTGEGDNLEESEWVLAGSNTVSLDINGIYSSSVTTDYFPIFFVQEDPDILEQLSPIDINRPGCYKLEARFREEIGTNVLEWCYTEAECCLVGEHKTIEHISVILHDENCECPDNRTIALEFVSCNHQPDSTYFTEYTWSDEPFPDISMVSDWSSGGPNTGWPTALNLLTNKTLVGVKPGGYYAFRVKDINDTGDFWVFSKQLYIPPHHQFYVTCVNALQSSGTHSPDGSIEVTVNGGVPPYTIVWTDDIADSTILENGGTFTRDELRSGCYSGTITDSGCNVAKNFICEVHHKLQLCSKICTDVTASDNGKIELLIVGGFPFSQTGTELDEYNVTITTSDGTLISPQPTRDDLKSAGGCGVVYSVADLAGGTYLIEIIDSMGNEVNACCLISSPSGLGVELFVPQKCCATLDDGESFYGLLCTNLKNSGVGGITYTYVWYIVESPGVEIQLDVVDNTLPYYEGFLKICSTYKVVVTGDSDPVFDTVCIKSPNCLSINMITTCSDASTCSYKIEASVTGGEAPYNFTWYQDSQLDAPIKTSTSVEVGKSVLGSVISGTLYMLVVRDSRGFKETGCIVATPMKASITFEDDGECDGDASDAKIARVVPTGGVAPYSYEWSNGCKKPFLKNADPSKEYCVTVKDSTGCSVLTQNLGCVSNSYNTKSLAYTILFYTLILAVVVAIIYLCYYFYKRCKPVKISPVSSSPNTPIIVV